MGSWTRVSGHALLVPDLQDMSLVTLSWGTAGFTFVTESVTSRAEPLEAVTLLLALASWVTGRTFR